MFLLAMVQHDGSGLFVVMIIIVTALALINLKRSKGTPKVYILKLSVHNLPYDATTASVGEYMYRKKRVHVHVLHVTRG
jgi:hypothetical protein